MKKELTKAEQDKRLKEIAFNDIWGKKCKLNPDLRNLPKNVGKAPKCGVRVKVAAPSVASTTNKKKR